MLEIPWDWNIFITNAHMTPDYNDEKRMLRSFLMKIELFLIEGLNRISSYTLYMAHIIWSNKKFKDAELKEKPS